MVYSVINITMKTYHYKCKSCKALTCVDLESRDQIFDVEEHANCPSCNKKSLSFYQPKEVDLVCTECKNTQTINLPRDEILERVPDIVCSKCSKKAMAVPIGNPGVSYSHGSKTPSGMKEVFAKIKEKTGQKVRSRFD